MATTPYIGAIQAFGFNYPPRGWALCQGQSLSISQNTALFSLLGTQYGGNGTTTFNLPDLRGRVPNGQGQGPGLSSYSIGQQGGSETVTLTQAQMPTHTHVFSGTGSSLNASDAKATVQIPPVGGQIARSADGSTVGSQPRIYVPAGTGNAVALGGLNVAGQIATAGGSQPHPNMQPFLTINYSIALTGIFPSRN